MLTWPERFRRAAPVLLVAAAAVLFHARVLCSPGHTFPWDFRSHHLPLATAYADSLIEGVAPLWEPYTYAGRPLLANPTEAARAALIQSAVNEALQSVRISP